MTESLLDARYQWCGETTSHRQHEHLVGVRMFNCRGVPGCTGADDCQADSHIHGCFADDGECDDPGEHEPFEVAPAGLESDD